MEDDQKTVEAVLVSDGKICAVGNYDVLLSQKSAECVLLLKPHPIHACQGAFFLLKNYGHTRTLQYVPLLINRRCPVNNENTRRLCTPICGSRKNRWMSFR